MQEPRQVTREAWGSKLGFILAAAGSAIGLGNIWRFPYVLGENGGFAFLLIYLVCVVLIGLPIMGAEMVIGRSSRRNPFGAFKALLPGSMWWITGAVGILTGVIILSYYNVVAGWTLAYLFKSVTGMTSSFTGPESAEMLFNGFVSDSAQVVAFQFGFTLLGVLVVSQGVKGGIERWSKILMPTLFILLLLLIGRSVTLPGSSAGLSFLFTPDFSKINGDVILMAMGQAFYSLSLGMGIMITYGSYLDNRTNIFSSTATVGGLDAGIAVLAGVAIFPAVFAMGLEPSSGFGLTYQVLPLVFSKLPFSGALSSLFFLLLTIAAITSAISLLEVMVSFATDELQWTRGRATWIMAAIAFLVGVPSALSFGVWEDVTIFGMGFFGFADYLTANILLPVGGILISVFAGWAWSRGVKSEMMKGSNQEKLFVVWLWAVRTLAPIAVGAILVFNFV